MSLGWDTETLDGKVWLLACSTGETATDRESVARLLLRHAGRDVWNVCYNLTYDAEALARLLLPDRKAALELLLYKDYYVEDLGITVSYIEGKVFSISKGYRARTSLYDVAQYYGHARLDDAARKYLGESKFHVQSDRLNDPEYIERHRDELVSYCIQDARLAARLADRYEQGVRLVYPEYRPGDLVSPAKTAERYIYRQGGRNFDKDLPVEVQRIAEESYRGGIFECWQRGHLESAYGYDVKSCYPFFFRDYQDVRGCEWVEDDDSDPLAAYAYARVNIHDLRLPLLGVKSRGFVIYPVGDLGERAVSTRELEMLKDEKASFDVLELYNGYNQRCERPFKDFVERFYHKKSTTEGAERDVYKLMLNGLSGKFIQNTDRCTRGKPKKKESFEDYDIELRQLYYRAEAHSKVHSYIYATETTARARCHIFKTLRGHEKDIIAMHTDSIFASRPLPLELSDELGGWSREHKSEPLTIVNNGVYYWHDSKVGRLRGAIAGEEGHVKDENRLPALLKAQPRGNVSFPLDYVRMLHLRECTNADLCDWTARIVPMRKEISVNQNRKRRWERPFHDCHDALESLILSEPISLDGSSRDAAHIA